jgi:secretory phospholipase A2
MAGASNTFIPLLLLTVGTFMSVQVLDAQLARAANGCGPEYFNIDPLYNGTALQGLIPCCNKHDICYETCGSNKSNCDIDFYFCMATACLRIPSASWSGNTYYSKIVCRAEGKVLFMIVVHFGDDSYKKAQKHCSSRG